MRLELGGVSRPRALLRLPGLRVWPLRWASFCFRLRCACIMGDLGVDYDCALVGHAAAVLSHLHDVTETCSIEIAIVRPFRQAQRLAGGVVSPHVARELQGFFRAVVNSGFPAARVLWCFDCKGLYLLRLGCPEPRCALGLYALQAHLREV